MGGVARCRKEANRRMQAKMEFSGTYRDVEIWRDGKLFKTLMLFDNGVCSAAMDDVNNVYLRNGTPKAAWYMGLIDNAGFTTLAYADTATSHTGWSENSSYVSATRPVWAPAASSAQAVVNISAVAFTINATVNIRGIFVISDSTKGGTAGLLYSTAAFVEGVQLLHNTDVLNVTTYTVSSAGS